MTTFVEAEKEILAVKQMLAEAEKRGDALPIPASVLALLETRDFSLTDKDYSALVSDGLIPPDSEEDHLEVSEAFRGNASLTLQPRTNARCA